MTRPEGAIGRRWQFHLRSLFALTTLFALALAVAKVLGAAGLVRVFPWLYFGTLAVYALIAGWRLWRAYRAGLARARQMRRECEALIEQSRRDRQTETHE